MSTASRRLASLTAIDCQGFAGSFGLGVVQAGFTLVGKREMPGGFGVYNCEVNRHLLGHHWQTEEVDPVEWTPYRVNLVFGNPPCSGFSTLSPKAFRGMDSKINECMWAFADYAARCQPEVAIFESVQAAFKKGQPLMQALRERVEQRTRRRWFLHHVLHNALSVGGCAMRKRYFWVISQVPFGLELPEPALVPSLGSVLGDLLNLPFTYEPQLYNGDSVGWWAREKRTRDGTVDGHQLYESNYVKKSLEMITPDTGPWEQGQRLQQRMKIYYDLYGDLPDSWERRKTNLINADFWCGASQLTRWRWDEPARVITGAGLDSVLHPLRDRSLTHREVARIMGYPDTWQIHTFGDQKASIRQTWGKQIPRECGNWIAGWARSAILGEPGPYRGEKIGEREYLVDVTNNWKSAKVV